MSLITIFKQIDDCKNFNQSDHTQCFKIYIGANENEILEIDISSRIQNLTRIKSM